MAQVQNILSKIQPGIHYSDIAFPPIEEKKESIFFSIFQRILSIIKEIFRYYVVAKTPKVFDLSKRQIKLIHQSENLRRKSVIYPAQIQVDAKEHSAPPSTLTTSINQDRQYDPSLHGLTQFLDSFSDVLINECVLNDLIKPNLPHLKKSLLEFFSGIDSWALVFQNIQESGFPIINGLRAVDDPAITLIAQLLLQYYVSLDRQIIHDYLTERLQELHMAQKITDKQHIQALQYIDPVFSWLYHSNNWFIKTSQPVNLHYFISDTFRFLDELANQIQAKTFTELFQNVEDFIHKDLNDEIEDILKINAPHITQILAFRLADLIEQLPFAETFDQWIHTFVEHTEGWISSEQVRQEQEDLVEKSQKVSKTRASKYHEIKQKREVDKLIELIKKDGGTENYLTNEFLWAFSNHSSCHKKIKELLRSQFNSDEMIEEGEIYYELIQKLFPILIPHSQYKLPFGLEIEINGISEILQQITLTDKLTELREMVIKEFDRLINESTIQKKENFREYFCAVTEIMVFEFVQTKIKRYLALTIQRVLERLSDKQYLDFLMAEYLFPSLLKLFLRGYVNSYMNKNLDGLAKFFHQMLMGHRHYGYEDLSKDLLEDLYLKIQQYFIDFNLEESNIDQDEFNLLIGPTINDIFEFINKDCQEIPENTISIENVTQSIKKYFNHDSVQINSDYGELAMNLLFRIGSFGGWFKKKVIGWFRPSISASASQSLKDVRRDHTKLVDSIVETANGLYLNADFIRKNFFSGEPSPEALEQLNERVSRELPEQIRHISSIIHDLFYRFLEGCPLPFIQYGTPSTDTISTLISDVYNNLFQQPSVNKSLIFSWADILQRALESANEEIHHNQLNPQNEETTE